MIIPAPFAAVDVNFDALTEMALLLDSVAGYAVLTYGPNFPGPGNVTHPTDIGLHVPALTAPQTHTADISIDGAGPVTVSVMDTVDPATHLTVADVLLAINTALGYTAAVLDGNDIVITSNTKGPNSSVSITDGVVPLFGDIKGRWFGLVNTSTFKGNSSYVAWDKLDGVKQSDVSSVVDAFLAATVANTNTPWSSGFDAMNFPSTITGSDDTGLDVDITYQIGIALDGGLSVNLLVPVKILETESNDVVSFADLVEAMNIAMYAAGMPATTSFVSGSTGQIVVTSNSVGATSAVAFAPGSSNDLRTALGATSISTVGSIHGAGYTSGGLGGTVVPGVILTGGTGHGAVADVTVDNGGNVTTVVFSGGTDSRGTGYSVNDVLGTANPLTGGSPSTAFSVTVTAIGVAIGAAATPGVNGATNVTFPVTKDMPLGNEKITYNSTPPVFTSTTTFNGWNDVMQMWPSPTGFGPLFTSGGDAAIVYKEKTPSAKGDAIRTAVYFDGTNWVYFDNGATLGAAVPPPERVSPY